MLLSIHTHTHTHTHIPNNKKMHLPTSIADPLYTVDKSRMVNNTDCFSLPQKLYNVYLHLWKEIILVLERFLYEPR